MNCHLCSKILTHVKKYNNILLYDHNCEQCAYMLCRTCDDKTTMLKWKELNDDDYYLCEKCYKNPNEALLKQLHRYKTLVKQFL